MILRWMRMTRWGHNECVSRRCRAHRLSIFSSGISSKFRPALVVQSDELNRKLTDTIVAGISSKMGLAGKEPTHVLVDPQAADGLSSGLIQTSVVKCHSDLHDRENCRSSSPRNTVSRHDGTS